VAEEFTTRALMAAMQRASDQLKARVAELVDRASAGLVRDHMAQMPRGTAPKPRGQDQRRLADRVARTEVQQFLHVVYSNSPHLHLVELGTRGRAAETRNRKTLKSPAYRGEMPRMGPLFVPLVVTRRAEMLRMSEALIGLDREL
jgi:hypothetical protein